MAFTFEDCNGDIFIPISSKIGCFMTTRSSKLDFYGLERGLLWLEHIVRHFVLFVVVE